MQISEASRVLADMYRQAADREKVISVHLFGIRYADQIRNISPKEIAIGAELPESYGTEIRKGINLSKYVTIRNT